MSRALSVAAVLAACLVAGCGEKSEDPGGGATEPLRLALDFYVNPDHAGVFEALDRGYFEEAGLDVSTEVPSDPSAPIRQVAAGRADLAISYEPEVILARDQGLPVRAVAALVPRPLTSLIWLRESGIKDVGDLAGKTVATAGIPYQSAFLEQILARADLTAGRRRGGERRPQPAARGPLRLGRRDAGRLPERRGRRPRATRPRPGGRARRPARDPDL